MRPNSQKTVCYLHLLKKHRKKNLIVTNLNNLESLEICFGKQTFYWIWNSYENCQIYAELT